MRRTIVILISVILIASFIWLVWYGIRHSRGVPVTVEKLKRPIIEAGFIDKDIDLSETLSPDIWEGIKAEEVGLVYQVTVLPWPKARDLVQPIYVKAFHNKQDIYFHLSWKDESQDRILETNKFSDACAIMFPMDEKAQPHSIMMGFLGRANIWQWKASQDREYWLKEERKAEAYADLHYPFEEKELFPVSMDTPLVSANDLIAIRIGTVTPKEAQNVSARGDWKDGIWQVVFKRAIKQADSEVDANFNSGKRLCAFAVWNGQKGDRGGRKTISDWAELEVK